MGYFQQFFIPSGTSYSLQKSVDFKNEGVSDKEILKLLLNGMTPEEIADVILADDFYSENDIKKNIKDEINIFRKREIDTKVDIKMADYLDENYDKYLMFATANHPTKRVMLELSRRVMKILGISDMIIECDDGEVCYPCPNDLYWFIYPSVLKALNLEESSRNYYCNIVLALDETKIFGEKIYEKIKSQIDEESKRYRINFPMNMKDYIIIYARMLSVLVCCGL